TWLYPYDSAGHLLSVTAPGPTAAGLTTTYTYDTGSNVETTNALQSIGYPNGSQQNFTYDAATGRLTGANWSGDNLTGQASITYAGGNTTRYGYDSAGNLLNITYPGGSQQSFAYDPLGNLSETTLQNGDPIAYQVNAQGLVTRQSFADGTSQTFDYDAHSNLL